MAEMPITRPSLLVRIRDVHDQQAWSQFVDLYGPVIYGYGRKRGLQAADAADFAQEVLRTVAVVAGRLEYDPQKGLFRSWLFTVARNKLHDFRIARSRQCHGSGDTGVQEMLEQQAAPEEQDLWNEEYRQQLLIRAAERVRSSFEQKTWQAFWQVAVEGHTPKKAAAALGMTLAAVYMAKSRVLAMLKKQIHEMVGDDACW